MCSTSAKCSQQSGIGKGRVEAAPAGAGISPEEFVGSVCVSLALNLLPEELVPKWVHSWALPEEEQESPEAQGIFRDFLGILGRAGTG